MEENRIIVSDEEEEELIVLANQRHSLYFNLESFSLEKKKNQITFYLKT
jgi:hypothetical protein